MAKGDKAGAPPRIKAQDTIPFGSVRPNITTTVMPDIGEKLTIPYGSLKTTAPAPVQSPPQPTSQQKPPSAPSSEKK